MRPYISRVENGHTVPSIETLEKMARALEIPMYQLFYDGYKPPALAAPASNDDRQPSWGLHSRDARYYQRLRRLLAKMSADDWKLLLHMIQKNGPGQRLRFYSREGIYLSVKYGHSIYKAFLEF